MTVWSAGFDGRFDLQNEREGRIKDISKGFCQSNWVEWRYHLLRWEQ